MINFRAMMAGFLIGVFSSGQLTLADVSQGDQEGTPQSPGQGPNAGQQGDPTVADAKNDEPEPPDCSVATIKTSFDQAKNRNPNDFSVKAKRAKYSEAAITIIQTRLKAGGYLTDQVDGKLGTQTYHALALFCQYLAAEGLLEPVADGEMLDLLTKKLETTASESGQTSRISLTAGDCGCSRDFSALSYGFLPYWFADGGAREVDFSVLDRIGFHGLQLGPDGRIVNESRWSDGSDSGSYIARLISTAHRHRVKVDATFYSSDWMNWDADKIGNAVMEISKSIGQQFRDESRDDDVSAVMERLLRKLLPFVEDNSTVRADGLNLYFDNYENATHASTLRKIVRDLRSHLQQSGPDATVNIILGLDWSGITAASSACSDEGLKHIDKKLFRELEGILVPGPDSDTDPESDIDMIEHVFVFLPQDHTSHAKKLLRRVIEDAFDGNGAARKTVLRKMVPIITTLPDVVPANYFKEGEQFVEDLIYLQDNFAGVGLWPLPVETQGDDSKEDASQDEPAESETGADDLAESHAEAIGARLIDTYGAGTGSGFLDAEIEIFKQQLCEFACPNRWLFRIVFDFLAVLAVIYGLVAVWNCKLRKFYQRRTPYFFAYGLLASMIFGVSLICDPFLRQRENVVMFIIIVLLVVSIGARYIRRARQSRMP